MDASTEQWKQRAARALEAARPPGAPEVEDLLEQSRAAVERWADDPEVWYLRGRLLGELGEAEGEALGEALRCLERARALRPDWFETLVATGKVLTRAARYEEAIDCFKRATELRPDRAEAHYLRGVALLAMERVEEALAQVDRALGLRVGQAPWWLTRLDIINKLGDCARLERCFSEMARWLTDAGATEEVLAGFDSLIAHDPEDPRHHAEKGCLLSHLGRQQEALTCCEQAIAREPEHALAWYVMARVRTERGELDEALAALGSATRHDPRLKAIARADDRLAALRQRPEFAELVTAESFDK